jgi:hypothetical protein
VTSNQLALRAFNGVAVFHPLLESLGLLLLAAGLQRGVMLSDDQCPVPLVFAQTALAQGAVVARSAEFEAITHFAAEFLFQATPLGVGLSSPLPAQEHFSNVARLATRRG